MFKNRSIQVKMIKDSDQQVTTAHQPKVWTPEKIQSFARDQVKYVALVGGGLYAAKKILDTTCEIALIKANH